MAASTTMVQAVTTMKVSTASTRDVCTVSTSIRNPADAQNLRQMQTSVLMVGTSSRIEEEDAQCKS